MNLKKLLCILIMISTALIFTSCAKKCKSHIDENQNGICDKCDATLPCQHRDADDNSLCDKCGESFSDDKDIEEHTHTYNQKNTDNAYLASAADCENAASYYYSCSCKEKGTSTFTSGDPLGHSFTVENAVDDRFASAADCENATTYYYSCSVCGAKGDTTFTIGDPLGHRDIDDDSQCDRCNKEYSDGKDTQDHPHTYDQKSTDNAYLYTAATCENPAFYYFSCSCGAKGTYTFASGDPLGHEYTEENTHSDYLVSEADCENAATYYYSCSCGAKGSAIFESGESLGGHRDADDDDICDKCAKVYSDGIEEENCDHSQDKDADRVCDICGKDLYVIGEDDVVIESPKHEFN